MIKNQKEGNMTELLEKSNLLYSELENCADFDEIGSCSQCLQDSFYNTNRDTYDCLKKLALYTLNYGPIYVSEVYHFLEQSQLLETYFNNYQGAINIYSLGSGFAPDEIAISKYNGDKQLGLHFNYIGFDKEPLWNTITQTYSNPITKNLLNPFNLSGGNIVFINKLYSTLTNHGLHTQFLTTFENALNSLPINSFVVFNDINRYNMGRDEFDRFVQSYPLEVVGKYYFKVEGAYSGNYTPIESIHNICEIPNTLSHSPKLEVHKTIIFLYRKVI